MMKNEANDIASAFPPAYAEQEMLRYPDVPEEEMKMVKKKFDSGSKYALCLCEHKTLLLVGSEKIPACYH